MGIDGPVMGLHIHFSRLVTSMPCEAVGFLEERECRNGCYPSHWRLRKGDEKLAACICAPIPTCFPFLSGPAVSLLSRQPIECQPDCGWVAFPLAHAVPGPCLPVLLSKFAPRFSSKPGRCLYQIRPCVLHQRRVGQQKRRVPAGSASVLVGFWARQQSILSSFAGAKTLSPSAENFQTTFSQAKEY